MIRTCRIDLRLRTQANNRPSICQMADKMAISPGDAQAGVSS